MIWIEFGGRTSWILLTCCPILCLWWRSEIHHQACQNPPLDTPTMVRAPLDVLKRGLNILQQQVKARKEKLQATLAEGKAISSQDECWLDNEANLVVEQQVVEALESTLDYEESLQRLDDMQNSVVQKLHEIVGDITKVVGKKRKCTHFCLSNYNLV